jgi:hypothetical protein
LACFLVFVGVVMERGLCHTVATPLVLTSNVKPNCVITTTTATAKGLRLLLFLGTARNQSPCFTHKASNARTTITGVNHVRSTLFPRPPRLTTRPLSTPPDVCIVFFVFLVFVVAVAVHHHELGFKDEGDANEFTKRKARLIFLPRIARRVLASTHLADASCKCLSNPLVRHVTIITTATFTTTTTRHIFCGVERLWLGPRQTRVIF